MIAGLKPYPEYKESGLPWLGRVPIHWNLPRLGSVLRERRETNEQKQVLQVLSVLKDVGVIRYEDKGNIGNKKSDDVGRYKVVEPDDIVVNCMNVIIGSVGLSRHTGCLSPVYYVLTRRSETDNPRYLAAIFSAKPFQMSLVRIGNGILAHRMRIPMELLKCEPVPVPPPPEQEAIVSFLNWANGRLERAIRAKRRIIALLNEEKQAIIHRAVTRGLDPSVPLKASGIPWLGDIPQHWEVKRAKQVCSAIVDCKNRTPDMVPGGNFVVVRTTNIRNGSFNLAGSYPTDQRNYEIWTQRGAPKQGDVFFTREAPVGEACLVPDQKNLCMGQRMMYFRPDTTVLDPGFLLYSIYGPVGRRYIEIESNGSTVGHLRLGQVTAFPLLWCPVEEQTEIVTHISIESAPLAKAISRLEREIELLREYRTRLTADVVTGKLDVREVAAKLPDEPMPDIEEESSNLNDDVDISDEEIME